MKYTHEVFFSDGREARKFYGWVLLRAGAQTVPTLKSWHMADGEDYYAVVLVTQKYDEEEIRVVLSGFTYDDVITTLK